jgi:nucleotide-binding universal stress UspA family protein
MTILVAYVPRPEGQAALDKGIEIARHRKEHLIVVNASPGGSKEDPSLADVQDYERVQQLLVDTGLGAEFKQYVRGNNAVAEIEALVESSQATLLVIGLRKRSPVGKLIMGSIAQELLLSVSCPVLAVKSV